MNSGNSFASLRFTDPGQHFAEGFSSLPPYVLGATFDSTVNGRLIVTRQGQTMSALIDRGSGPVLLGSLDSPELLGPMKVQAFAVQAPHLGIRPTTALDVRFDNFIATAETIVPEPSAFLTWGGLVGMGLIGGWWRRRCRRG